MLQKLTATLALLQLNNLNPPASETANLTNITSALLRQHPEVLPILRMAAAPPIARDRLIGLARVSQNLVKNMEEKQGIPPRADIATLDAELTKISQIIARLLDKDIFTQARKRTAANGD